jgi:N-methyl-L-tryptophan oxidase
MARSSTAIVVGAGAAGASTALELQRRGFAVTLIDAFEPGHPRAASCGEHRMLRSSHGADELYSRWSRQARLSWLELADEVGRELFVQNGVVLLAHEGNTVWEEASCQTLERLRIPHFRVPPDELALRLPVADVSRMAFGVWEPESGLIYSREAILATVRRLVDLGGKVVRGQVTPGTNEYPQLDGKPLEADVIACACGVWMRDLFPRTLGPMLTVQRQDVILVAPPAGSRDYDHDRFPNWIDHAYPAYGVPNARGAGFKAVITWHHLSIDADNDDRVVSASTMARSRRYLAARFPALTERPIIGQEVGHFATTADTHFIIDRHPAHERVMLIGGDSGHLFKHGPAIGSYVADLVTGQGEPEPRFAMRRRSRGALADRPQ